MDARLLDQGFGENQELTIDSLPVSGEIPSWLSGTLIRNGPGTFQIGQQRYRHWFDGLAMLHRFTIHNGNVSYANKFLETKSYSEARKADRILYSEFATDPCRSLFARAMAIFDPNVTDSAKVNIEVFADRYVALAETPIQVEFDAITLKSIGVIEWDSSSFGRMTTVHPHIDSRNGVALNLVTRFNAISNYCFRRMDLESKNLDSFDLAKFRVREPSYIHSFGMSENFVILVEYPLVVNPVKLLLWLKPYIENFEWKPNRGTKFHIFDRSSGKLIKSISTDPFFAFHHVNAYDDGEKLIVDLVAYDDNNIIESFYLQRLAEPDSNIPAGKLWRFQIDLGKTNGSIKKCVISDVAIEMPIINYQAFNSNPEYRFIYGIGLHGDRSFYNQIVKIDIENESNLTWHESNRYPGEPIFVKHPDGENEDDGVLLSVVLDSQAGNSFLLILDASNFKEIARAVIPHPILFGYHGKYVAS